MSSVYVNMETGARTYRIVLPSRLRRGRMAAAPVFRVDLRSGEVWQFQRRKDALRFAAAGDCQHDDACRFGRYCNACLGERVTP